MARIDELRLMAKVARLYYEAGQKQPEIAERLSLSQATISRLLKRAEREQIVRISVSVPTGAFPELEEGLSRRYGLREVIVADSLEDDEAQVMRDLGAAAAYYVETTLRPGEVVGVASYASLLAMVNAMHPRGAASAGGGVRVVQLTGGVGNPSAEAHGTQLTRRLADLLRGEAVFLPAPGLAATEGARDMFLQDRFVREALEMFERVTLALMGIQDVRHSGPTGYLGSYTEAERRRLLELGAQGFVCHRFYDSQGTPLATPFDRRLLAITPPQLFKVERRVGISGGPARLKAIRAAVEGDWINVLITDRFTAERLLA